VTTKQTKKRQAINFDEDSPQLREMEAVTTQGLADRFATDLTTATGSLLAPTLVSSPAASLPGQRREAFVDVSHCREGATYEVPLHLVRPNPYGARYFYHADEVDAIGASMQANEQDEPAKGFVDGDHITLIDGGTRLRAARSTGRPTLAVTIRKAPAGPREMLRESARMNIERSEHTALDLAMIATQMLAEGLYKTHDEIAADLPTRDGKPMDRASVVRLLRIGKIPERVLRTMSEHEKTSGLRAAYEVSALFVQDDYDQRVDEYMAMAEEVIDEIQKKDLTLKQTIDLVASKLRGPKPRHRPNTWPIAYANARGHLKVFADRGEVHFSLRGLSPDEMADMQRKLEGICKPQAATGTSAG